MQERKAKLIFNFQIHTLLKLNKKGRLITSHRSTAYSCCIPALGGSAGAGRVRPAGRQR